MIGLSLEFQQCPHVNEQEVHLGIILNKLYKADDIQPLPYLEMGRVDLGMFEDHLGYLP